MTDYEMFDVCEVGEAAIIRLRASELDETKLHRLTHELASFGEQPGRQRLVIDLGTVVFLTSTGIGALIAFKKKFQAGGGVLKLCGLNRDIRSLFAITQVDRLFDIQDNADSAVQSPW